MSYKQYHTHDLYGKNKLYVKYKDYIHQIKDVYDDEYVQLSQYDAMYDIKRIERYMNEVHMQELTPLSQYEKQLLKNL